MEDDERGYYFEEEPQAKVKAERPHHKRRRGCFRRAIPSMPLSFSVLCCLLNFCIPGLGTVISSFTVISCADGACCTVWLNILCGLLQFLTAPLLIGIIWSYQWGILFIQMSLKWYRPIQNRSFAIDCLPCSSC